MPKMVRAHLIIKGLVQGVFFRATTQSVAEGNRVKGWVRNRTDGSVEAVLEGEKEDVDRVIEWCHHGPLGARVDEVEVEWEEYKNEFNGFSIRY